MQKKHLQSAPDVIWFEPFILKSSSATLARRGGSSFIEGRCFGSFRMDLSPDAAVFVKVQVAGPWRLIWGFPARHGLPQKWLVFVRENPNLKWMIKGYPYFRKPPYDIYLYICIYIYMCVNACCVSICSWSDASSVDEIHWALAPGAKFHERGAARCH